LSVASPVIDRIDGPTRRIFLRAGVRSFDPVDDIYKEVRNLRRLDETLRGYDMFVSAGGNIPRPGKPPTDRFLVLLLGTKIVPEDTSHTLAISGEMFTDDELDPETMDFSSLSPGVSVFVSDTVTKSVLTELQAQQLANIDALATAQDPIITDTNTKVTDVQTKVTAMQVVQGVMNIVLTSMEAMVILIRDYWQADEEVRPGSYQLKHKDTKAVIKSKTVTPTQSTTIDITE